MRESKGQTRRKGVETTVGAKAKVEGGKGRIGICTLLSRNTCP